MTPDERRQAIIDATLPLLLEKGPELSTREIATAAGVAEGTIFRVFETKSDLIEATIHAALEPATTLHELQALPAQSLEDRVISVLTVLVAEIGRTRALFAHLAGSGFHPRRPHPPTATHGHTDSRMRVLTATSEALAPYAGQLRVPVETASKLLNALAFSSSFTLSANQLPPTPQSLASVVLHGIAEGEK